MSRKTRLHQLFIDRFKREPQIFIAPGRINLIGEHTDYNEGFVMPAAIDKHVIFVIAPNGTDQFNIVAADYSESKSFTLTDAVKGDSWENYLMGVASGIRQLGFDVKGVDCVFGSTIPVGAGLSSSAALCCGFGFALSELGGLGISRLGIAKIAQYAEHHFAGVMCGIMDQYASVFGEEDNALLLDCRSLQHETVYANLGDYTIVLTDTKVKHALASTGYNDRRASCETAIRVIATRYPDIKSLRDVPLMMLLAFQDQLGEDVFVKARYVVEQIEITQRAARYLKEENIHEFGKLMFTTHWGLSKSYDVSCAELDYLVELAELSRDFVIGSRMMGGGFGGCTISLMLKEKVDFWKGYVHEKYFATFKKEPDFYLVNLSRGVHQIHT